MKEEAGAAWNMRAFGRFITNEKIAVVPGGFVPSVSFKDGKATLVTKLRLAKGESRTLDWFVTYEDDLSKSLPIINPVPLDEGPLPSYDVLRAAHVADWARYFSASSIDVPDARIRAMSDMAVKGGRVERLTITCAHPSPVRKVRIVPPAGLGLAPQTVILDRKTIEIVQVRPRKVCLFVLY